MISRQSGVMSYPCLVLVLQCVFFFLSTLSSISCSVLSSWLSGMKLWKGYVSELVCLFVFDWVCIVGSVWISTAPTEVHIDFSMTVRF